MSGVDTCVKSATLDTSIVGPHSYTVTSTDKAGNSAMRAVHYNVIYKFGGFLSPAKKNQFKGGTIPLKLKLFDANNSPISTAMAKIYVDGNPRKSSGSSNTGNNFRYDTTSQQYIFNLSTQGLSTGKHIVLVHLDDATDHIFTILLK